MIQRIQTLFLLAALVCMLLLLFFPYGYIISPENEIIRFYVLGTEYSGQQNEIVFPIIPVSINVIIVCLITLVTIFLYKKRMLQIRLSFFNLIMQLGTMILMYYFIYNANKTLGWELQVSFMIIMPLAAMILTFLAIRGIGRDEALVRSVNRIR